jgi:hypothetical protein
MLNTTRLASTAVIAALGLGACGATAAAAAAAAPTPTPTPSASASATPTPSASASATPTPSGSTDPNLYPFGAPSGGVAVKVPPPPGQPTLSPTYTTKTTTRLYGADPYEEAVSVTQHVWPAALPANAPNETNNVPDRPWGVTLITTDDPLTGISAVPLLHFPDDAPILYVTKTGIPTITLNELKRLGDTGIVRPPMNNADAFLVGAGYLMLLVTQIYSS